MMKKERLLPLLLVFLVGFFSQCGKPLSPKYLGYQNFRLAKAGFENNVLATEIKLYNPNPYPLQFKSANVDVYFNGAFLGHSQVDSVVVLPAKDTAYIPLQMQAKTKDVLSNALKVFLNPDVKIRIAGSVKAGRGGMFFNVPIDYEGVQRISLSDFR